MMEIKLTDKQFEQLQTELRKDVIKRSEASKTSKKKFIDVTVAWGGLFREPLQTRLISICIDNIVALVDYPDHQIINSEILLNINMYSHYCLSTTDEIKQMIKEAENND